MRPILLTCTAIAALAITGVQAQQAPGPYSVVKTATVGGEGGFDYVYADVAGRRLYVPRSGQGAIGSNFRL